jgi:hypothetical protein
VADNSPKVIGDYRVFYSTYPKVASLYAAIFVFPLVSIGIDAKAIYLEAPQAHESESLRPGKSLVDPKMGFHSISALTWLFL